MSDCDEDGCQNYAVPGHQYCSWHESNPRKATTTETGQGRLEWSDDDCHAAIRAIAHRDLPDMRTLSVTEFQAEQLMFMVRHDLRRTILQLEREVSRLAARIDALEMDKAELQAIGWELQAELAERGQWVPVGVTTYSTDDATIAIADEEISIIQDDSDGLIVLTWILPDSVRVCRLVTQGR